MRRPLTLGHPVMKVLLPLAAVAPATLFVALWRLLNAPFAPYIGEGYDSPAACATAGVFVYLWIIIQLVDRSRPESGNGPVLPLITRVYWHLLAATVAIPGGRVLFSILPPWDNAMGGLIGALAGHAIVRGMLSKGHGRFVHSRGTVVITEAEAVAQIKSLPRGSEPRIRWAGFDLPGEVAVGNHLTVGAIGTGKTRMHRQTLKSLLPHIRSDSDRRVLIYDVKSDLLAELETMGVDCEVLVFNPFDRRAVAWDIASDVRTPEQARHFAEALILPATGNDKQFFTTAARNIVAGVINALNERCPGQWTLRDLVRVTATKGRLEQLLHGSDLIAQYFSPPDTFDNIRNTIANVTVELEPVAALWERTTRKISLKDWVTRGGSVLVLGGKENLQASLEPLNRVAFKIITTDFLSEPESPTRSRLWFFCDELKTAGRLNNLPAILNARSKGVRSVLGLQDLEGLIDAYGSKEKVQEMVSRCATVSWLKLTSTETAEWASKRSGEFERFEYFDTQTKDGINVGENLTKREAVLPSEFLNLPDFAGGNVGGIHLIRGVNGVFHSTAAHSFPELDRTKDFQPRDASEQVLSPWTESDAQRLGMADLPPVTTPARQNSQPQELDLGSLARVSLKAVKQGASS